MGPSTAASRRGKPSSSASPPSTRSRSSSRASRWRTTSTSGTRGRRPSLWWWIPGPRTSARANSSAPFISTWRKTPWSGSSPRRRSRCCRSSRPVTANSKIIIMDEPTSSLGLEDSNSLMDLIRSLKAQGIGIIYISHYLEEIFEIGDRITILKDGESMGAFLRSEIDMDTVIRKMVGRDASLFYAKEEVTPGPVQLEVRQPEPARRRRGREFRSARGGDLRPRRPRGLGPQRTREPHLRRRPQGQRGDSPRRTPRTHPQSPRRRGSGNVPHHGGQEKTGHVHAAQRGGEHRHRAQRALRAAGAEPRRRAAACARHGERAFP